MAVRLVKIVNANGRTGWVPETHPRLVDGSLRKAPSESRRATARAAAPDETARTTEVEATMPRRNASTDVWRRYGVSQGLTRDEADAMSRDELRRRFTEE